jgi:hypothetical protein
VRVRSALAVVVAGCAVARADVSAHRLDEYLQASRIAVDADHVSIDLTLTPGAAVAPGIIAAIDSNADGVLSSAEQQAYADDVVRALDVRLDRSRLPLRLVASTFPDVGAFRTGDGAIQLRVDASHASLAGGAHQLFLKNSHWPQQSVYLANALVPDNARVAVTDQQRDGAQSQLTIHYAVEAAQARDSAIWWLAAVAGVVAAVVLLARAVTPRFATSRA